MYGTIFRMKPRSGQEQSVFDVFNDWERDVKPNVQGALGGFLFKPDAKPDELIGVAIFESKDSYLANANNAIQDAWFRKLRELLQSDPEWEDGEYVVGSLS